MQGKSMSTLDTHLLFVCSLAAQLFSTSEVPVKRYLWPLKTCNLYTDSLVLFVLRCSRYMWKTLQKYSKQQCVRQPQRTHDDTSLNHQGWLPQQHTKRRCQEIKDNIYVMLMSFLMVPLRWCHACKADMQQPANKFWRQGETEVEGHWCSVLCHVWNVCWFLKTSETRGTGTYKGISIYWKPGSVNVCVCICAALWWAMELSPAAACGSIPLWCWQGEGGWGIEAATAVFETAAGAVSPLCQPSVSPFIFLSFLLYTFLFLFHHPSLHLPHRLH